MRLYWQDLPKPTINHLVLAIIPISNPICQSSEDPAALISLPCRRFYKNKDSKSKPSNGHSTQNFLSSLIHPLSPILMCFFFNRVGWFEFISSKSKTSLYNNINISEKSQYFKNWRDLILERFFNRIRVDQRALDRVLGKQEIL